MLKSYVNWNLTCFIHMGINDMKVQKIHGHSKVKKSLWLKSTSVYFFLPNLEQQLTNVGIAVSKLSKSKTQKGPFK